MNRYYSSNALYEQLEGSGSHEFYWAVGNSWALVYGDTRGIPKLVVFASGTSIEELDDLGKERIQSTLALAGELARRAGLPFGTIEFDDRAGEISEVLLNKKIVNLDELKMWFAKYGLAVKRNEGGPPLKAINDASSSAYHKWQRSVLGQITVTDIDLVRVDAKNSEPKAIYELKRSYIPLDSWAPFRADYSNFNLASAFAGMSKVNFFIVYNVRHKAPKFFDDVSRLRIFSYSDQAGAKSLAMMSFDDFVQEQR